MKRLLITILMALTLATSTVVAEQKSATSTVECVAKTEKTNKFKEELQAKQRENSKRLAEVNADIAKARENQELLMKRMESTGRCSEEQLRQHEEIRRKWLEEDREKEENRKRFEDIVKQLKEGK